MEKIPPECRENTEKKISIAKLHHKKLISFASNEMLRFLAQCSLFLFKLECSV